MKSINSILRRKDDSSNNLSTYQFKFQVCISQFCIKTLWKKWFDRQLNYKKRYVVVPARLITESRSWEVVSEHENLQH